MSSRDSQLPSAFGNKAAASVRPTLHARRGVSLRHALRRAAEYLPRSLRFALLRGMAHCPPKPHPLLTLKVAGTQAEFEGCFRLLHDSYVRNGFMKPDPSGMRISNFHALPTTTTLCAQFNGMVVGTVSIVREGVFGFPMQSVFDLSDVRAQQGPVAEISALAIHPDFRHTSGSVLFPLLKLVYEYCASQSDIRHLVIAVPPKHIEMFEALLFFKRLPDSFIESYDFANGAPAIGASLDLKQANALLKQHYGDKSSGRNLHAYFTQLRLPNIQWSRTNQTDAHDQVMTPAMLDYFFNQRRSGFRRFDKHMCLLMRSVYSSKAYSDVLPAVSESTEADSTLRKYERYALKRPGHLELKVKTPDGDRFDLKVTELSRTGFQAEADFSMPLDVEGTVTIQLGQDEQAVIKAVAVRYQELDFGMHYGFRIQEADPAWERYIDTLQRMHTSGGEVQAP